MGSKVRRRVLAAFFIMMAIGSRTVLAWYDEYPFPNGCTVVYDSAASGDCVQAYYDCHDECAVCTDQAIPRNQCYTWCHNTMLDCLR